MLHLRLSLHHDGSGGRLRARRITLAWLCLALALLPYPAWATEAHPPSGLDSAERFLLQGRADAAAAALHSVLVADPESGAAHLLLCRVWLSEGLGTQAAAECQAALADGLGNNSTAQDWTGRALGMQAAHAGMLAGLKLALGVHTAFEAAVTLDPTSEAACVDLGEYYIDAPAIVGGGSARALALAARIERALPAVSHRIRAMAAEKDKDLATAEREFQAEAAAGHTPGSLVDLATFYERHHEDRKAVETARETIAVDQALDATVVEAAGVLDDAHQTQLAEEAMRSYLSHGVRSDSAPAFRVLTTLGSLQARAGDKTEARTDYQQALALASQYRPAQKGLGAL